MTKTKKRFFGLIKVKPRKDFIGLIRFEKDKWIFKIYGSRYLELALAVTRTIKTKFTVEIMYVILTEEKKERKYQEIDWNYID